MFLWSLRRGLVLAIVATVYGQAGFPQCPAIGVQGLNLTAIATTCKCGRTGPVYHTEEGYSTEVQYVWRALVLLRGVARCGGSIISDRYIMTSGRCVHGLDVSDITVALGVNRTTVSWYDTFQPFDESRVYTVDRIAVHPQYARRHRIYGTEYLLNDIALVRLQDTVNYTLSVGPVCLPAPDVNHDRYTVETAILNALKVQGANASHFAPEEVKVKILSESQAEAARIRLAGSKMIFSSPDPGASCGDATGWPLVYAIPNSNGTYEQIGISSWGLEACGSSALGAHTRVTDYLGWIEAETADSAFCETPEQSFCAQFYHMCI